MMSAGPSLGLSAQTVSFSEDKDFNAWLATGNPVSVGIVTMPDVGRTGFDAESTSGDFHKAMESGGINAWGFSSSGYKSLKPLNLWGSFKFSQERHRDRNWSDNIHPYNGNPYLTGSSLKGKYSYQMFDFSVKMASKPLFGFMWAGVALDYSLGDFSRLQDPRSRTQEIDYSVRPGVAFQFGKERFGLNISYGYGKEKIGSYVSKSKNAKEYLLYLQEGLGVFSTLVSSAYERRIESWKYGVALQYEHLFSGNTTLLAEVSPFYRSDNVEDAYQATPGDYKEAGCGVFVILRSGNWSAEGSFRLVSGSADKISQKAVTVTDPASGVTSTRYETIFSIKSYTSGRMSGEVGLSYVDHDDKPFSPGKWNVGGKVGFGMSDDEYVYYSPASSFVCGNIMPSVHGGGTILSKKNHSLTLYGELAYRVNVSDRLSVSDELQDRTIVENVIMPDRTVVSSDFIKASADLRYVFPLPAKAIGKTLSGFASLSASMYFVPGFQGSGRNIIGVSVGVIH